MCHRRCSLTFSTASAVSTSRVHSLQSEDHVWIVKINTDTGGVHIQTIFVSSSVVCFLWLLGYVSLSLTAAVVAVAVTATAEVRGAKVHSICWFREQFVAAWVFDASLSSHCCTRATTTQLVIHFINESSRWRTNVDTIATIEHADKFVVKNAVKNEPIGYRFFILSAPSSFLETFLLVFRLTTASTMCHANQHSQLTHAWRPRTFGFMCASMHLLF